jgi:hypothetical protein
MGGWKTEEEGLSEDEALKLVRHENHASAPLFHKVAKKLTACQMKA